MLVADNPFTACRNDTNPGNLSRNRSSAAVARCTFDIIPALIPRVRWMPHKTAANPAVFRFTRTLRVKQTPAESPDTIAASG
ncbi:hypothetical protein [Allorhizobium sonneratiae]|uniref:hypothetical protein n=1 Tax=Allorhizobium sonneratiae TaxID=2934936 RepID=UPI002034026B|nr:hypothetical protein [Allorhizobium sonneratiae]